MNEATNNKLAQITYHAEQIKLLTRDITDPEPATKSKCTKSWPCVYGGYCSIEGCKPGGKLRNYVESHK